jgi:hypothetical protein
VTTAQINTRPEPLAATARSKLSANKWDRAALTAGPVAPGLELTSPGAKGNLFAQPAACISRSRSLYRQKEEAGSG